MPMRRAARPKSGRTSSRTLAKVKVVVRSGRLRANWPQGATPTSAARAVLGVMRPRMQVSFLSDCHDVALPALKLDPDTEMARVDPADVEGSQRAVMHAREGSG